MSCFAATAWGGLNGKRITLTFRRTVTSEKIKEILDWFQHTSGKTLQVCMGGCRVLTMLYE